MIRQNSSSPLIMPGPLLAALLGAAFCVWSASGNALFCVTTGCTLFQDLTVGGVSLWWFGAAAFGLLAFLALSGRPGLGVLAAGVCVLADMALLLLMLLTAPCVGCLFAALLFALCYAAFRQAGAGRGTLSRSWLLLAWGVLFVVNIGATLRMEAGTWAMAGPQDATVHVYFSPSCSACREAVTALSGRVNVAFYPVAENAEDVTAIAGMLVSLDAGASMADALLQARAADAPGFWGGCSPDMLMLRFRLLRNKAHVLASGSHTVPFIEYQGLPAGLVQKPAGQNRQGMPQKPAPDGPRDATLPIDGEISGSCGGASATPCP